MIRLSRIATMGAATVLALMNAGAAATEIALPKPQTKSAVSLEETLLKRRSDRDFTSAPLTLAQVSQLLWAAQGVTRPGGLRTAPSAGATYPLETYLVVGNVTGIAPAIYHYSPAGHTLTLRVDGDKRGELAAAAGQDFIRQAPVVIGFAAVPERTAARYGAERGLRYVHMEVGHAGENVQLQGISLGLGSVVVGAFNDREVRAVLTLQARELPMYLIPVGHLPRETGR